jgi:hypothetical protein
MVEAMVSPGKAIRFSDLDFGMAAAEKELTRNPDLLLQGFLDRQQFVQRILDGEKFLVLGPKGSGKSAIGSRIELLARVEGAHYARSYVLENLSYQALSGLLPGQEAPEVKFETTWEFLLLVAIVDSLSRDPAAKSLGRVQLANVVDGLQQLGLLPCGTFADLVKTSSTRELKLRLPELAQFGGATTYSAPARDLGAVLKALQESVYSATAGKKHYLLIDGLDSVLTKREKQYDALSALLMAADRINHTFRKNSVPIYVVIFCRTDVLDEKLQSPNKNKIRQDSAVVLDWYQDTLQPMESNLFQLVNRRASLAVGREADIFVEFLPASVLNGDPTYRTILENTRHLPRDLIILLNKIKDHSKRVKPLTSDVLNALREYSVDYLYPEIRDELTGFLEPEEVSKVFSLIMRTHQRRFSYAELESHMKQDQNYKDFNLRGILGKLFDVSAIGNYHRSRYLVCALLSCSLRS